MSQPQSLVMSRVTSRTLSHITSQACHTAPTRPDPKGRVEVGTSSLPDHSLKTFTGRNLDVEVDLREREATA